MKAVICSQVVNRDQNGMLIICRWLLKHSGTSPFTKNEKKETCVHIATKYGHLGSLKTMLCVEFWSYSTAWHDTDSHLVGSHRSTHVHKLGNHTGNIKFSSSISGSSVIPNKKSTRNLPTALLLAKKRDHCGMTALHLAAMLGHAHIVNWLVRMFGSPLVSVINKLGQTALHFAAGKGLMNIFIL